MKILAGGVANGKTFAMVKLCVEAGGGIIVARDKNAINHIKDICLQQGWKMPRFMTYRDAFLRQPTLGSKHDKIYVDGADEILSEFLRCEPAAVTLTGAVWPKSIMTAENNPHISKEFYKDLMKTLPPGMHEDVAGIWPKDSNHPNRKEQPMSEHPIRRPKPKKKKKRAA